MPVVAVWTDCVSVALKSDTGMFNFSLTAINTRNVPVIQSSLILCCIKDQGDFGDPYDRMSHSYSYNS